MNYATILGQAADRLFGAPTPPRRMSAYRVQIKAGARVVREFTAMGPDSCTVAQQHEDLCAPGEYVKVDPCEA
jgi:hypothetical protein